MTGGEIIARHMPPRARRAALESSGQHASWWLQTGHGIQPRVPIAGKVSTRDIRTPTSHLEKTYPLKHLLPLNILQPTIQVLHALHQIRHLALILALDLARLPNRHVQRNPHRPVRGARQPPARRGVRLGRETDLVVARVGGGEGEAAVVRVALVDDAVVVVEDFVDSDEHLERGVDGVGAC